MRLETELRELYNGGRRSKIELQNNGHVKSLASFLIDNSDGITWQFYIDVLMPLVRSGGRLVFCDGRPHERWIESMLIKFGEGDKLHARAVISRFNGHVRDHQEIDWYRLSRYILDEKVNSGWLRPSGEVLCVCTACGHCIISDWQHVGSIEACALCGSDVLKFIPYVIDRKVKEALQDGLVLEVAVAMAIVQAGGDLFKVSLDDGKEHYVSYNLSDPGSAVECDGIADLDDCLVFVECKNKLVKNVLGSNIIELSASKVKRVISALDERIRELYKDRYKLIIVTTGALHQDMDRDVLIDGQFSGIPCQVIDNPERDQFSLDGITSRDVNSQTEPSSGQ